MIVRLSMLALVAACGLLIVASEAAPAVVIWWAWSARCGTRRAPAAAFARARSLAVAGIVPSLLVQPDGET